MTTTNLEGRHNDADVLRDALFGRSVVDVKMYEGYSGPKVGYYRAEGEVHLDDGTILYLAGNEGGCSCGSGDYYLSKLNDLPVNGITNVEIKATPKSENRYEDAYTYSIFVLTMGGEPVELASFEGDDGNGYYGTGFWFTIVAPEGVA